MTRKKTIALLTCGLGVEDKWTGLPGFTWKGLVTTPEPVVFNVESRHHNIIVSENPMNRNAEYNALLAELDAATIATPPALADAVARANAKARRARRIRNVLVVPATAVTILFAAFVTAVNVSADFAELCEQTPILRELAAAVERRPSLKAAVENEYVQSPNGLVQTENDVTMTIEHLIADEKELHIFYRLRSDNYKSLGIEPRFRKREGDNTVLSCGFGYGGTGVDKIQSIKVSFSETTPDSLVMECDVYDRADGELYPGTQIATFRFPLHVDPDKIKLTETITLDKPVVIDGQKFTVTTVEIRPTHTRLFLTDDPDNTAWLKRLDIYAEDENGERYPVRHDGSTSVWKGVTSLQLESSSFSKGKRLTLHITGADWLDRDAPRAKIDLANVAAEGLPQGVALERAIRKGDSWRLVFSYVPRNVGQLFEWGTYYDEAGTQYRYHQSSSYSGYVDEHLTLKDRSTEAFELKDYPFDVVYLQPHYTRWVTLDTPVEIAVK